MAGESEVLEQRSLWAEAGLAARTPAREDIYDREIDISSASLSHPLSLSLSYLSQAVA